MREGVRDRNVLLVQEREERNSFTCLVQHNFPAFPPSLLSSLSPSPRHLPRSDHMGACCDQSEGSS